MRREDLLYTLALAKFADQANHTAFYLGQAARDITHPTVHVDASSRTEAMKLRAAQLGRNLVKAVQGDDGKEGDAQAWFLYGLNPWKHPDPETGEVKKQRPWPAYLKRASEDKPVLVDADGQRFAGLGELARHLADKIRAAVLKAQQALGEEGSDAQ